MAVIPRYTDQLVALNTPAAHDEVVAMAFRYGVSTAQVMRDMVDIALPQLDKSYAGRKVRPVMSESSCHATRRGCRWGNRLVGEVNRDGTPR